jgi:hypothetical protein
MKPLSEVCPDPNEVLKLRPEELGQHVLGCLRSNNEPEFKRATTVEALSSNYHDTFKHEISHAIEKALDWLTVKCFIGVGLDEDMICLTQPVKESSSDEQAAAS